MLKELMGLDIGGSGEKFLSDKQGDKRNHKKPTTTIRELDDKVDNMMARITQPKMGTSYWGGGVGDYVNNMNQEKAWEAMTNNHQGKLDSGYYDKDMGGSSLADAGLARTLNAKGKLENGYYGGELRTGGSGLNDAGYARTLNEQGKVDAGFYDTDTAKSIAEQIADLENSGVDTGYSGNLNRPELRSAIDFADLHGINYDMDYMKNLMDEATTAKYNNMDTEYGRTLRDYYNMSARTADDLSSAMMAGDRDAMISGATGGTNLASQLATMSALADTTSQGATELSQGRADLVNQRESELAQNATTALTMYNELGINLATLSARELEALAEVYAGELGYEATIKAAQMAANAQKIASLQNRLGLEASAHASANATMNAAKLNADASKYNADSSLRMLNDPNYQSWLTSQNK